MDQKIKRIALCLYAIGALKFISMLYSFMVQFEAMQELSKYNVTHSSFNFFGINLVLDILILIILLNTIKELKHHKASAWALSILICLATAPSLALPASIYTLVLLFNEEIRTRFIKELEDKIKF